MRATITRIALRVHHPGTIKVRRRSPDRHMPGVCPGMCGGGAGSAGYVQRVTKYLQRSRCLSVRCSCRPSSAVWPVHAQAEYAVVPQVVGVAKLAGAVARRDAAAVADVAAQAVDAVVRAADAAQVAGVGQVAGVAQVVDAQQLPAVAWAASAQRALASAAYASVVAWWCYWVRTVA